MQGSNVHVKVLFKLLTTKRNILERKLWVFGCFPCPQLLSKTALCMLRNKSNLIPWEGLHAFQEHQVLLVKPRLKTTKPGLRVLGLACKRLGSCHSTLITWKCWLTIKINNTFLRCVREPRSQGKFLSIKLETSIGKYWKSQLTSAETSMETSAGVQKPEL